MKEEEEEVTEEEEEVVLEEEEDQMQETDMIIHPSGVSGIMRNKVKKTDAEITHQGK